MNNALYIFLDTNKETIFEQYPEAVHFIESYRIGCDRQGYLLNLIEDNHPTLKKHRVDDDDTQPAYHNSTISTPFMNSSTATSDGYKMRN